MLAGVALLFLALAAPGAASAQDATAAEANQHFQAQDWAKAAPAYEAITKAAPANGQAWFRLGQARHGLGEYAMAIEAYTQAQSNGMPPGPVRYRTARAYAKLGDSAKALDALEQLVQGGFANAPLIENDADLASLRGEVRFTAVVEQAKKNARPCHHDSNYRKFDFWVGEWNVTVGGQQAGVNRIDLIEGNCVVFENWTGAGGGSGRSFNFYNNQTGKWNQVWVASNGSNLFFEGEFRDGNLHYTGTTVGAGGAKTLHKLTFFNLGPGHVRQLWESSTDDGKTWSVVFDGDYRQKGAAGALPASDVEAIRGVLERYTRGWLQGDAEMVMSALLDDAVIMPHHGVRPREGAAAIREFWWPPNSPPTKVTDFRMLPDEVSGGSELAYARGRFHLGYSYEQDGVEKSVSNAGTFLIVAKRDATGAWRISRFMWDDPPAQPR